MPDMPADTPTSESPHQQGCRLACEGILRSQFGRRPSTAVSKALERIEREEREGRIIPLPQTESLSENVGQASSLPVHGASSPRVPGGRMPPELADKMSAPHFQTGSEASRRPFTLPLLSLAAGIALLFSLGAWFFAPTMGPPVLADVRGSDVSFERGTELIPATAGIHLQPADVLRTGTNSTATIAFGSEKTRLELSAETELKLVSLAHGKRLALRIGKLEATVARQRPFKPLLVRTPNAEARVLGTEFTLTAATNHTRLDVTQGRVRLTRTTDSAAAKVGAGQYAVVAAGTELNALPQTGSILREYWTNFPGNEVNDLLDHPDYPDRPNGRDYVDLLEVPAAGATNYGCRLVGYLHPPVTGQYIFWIAASPAAAVNLSPNENPAYAIRIFGDNFDFGRGRESQPREWERKASISRTQSQPVTLVAGRRYFIEAVHKADDRVGHLAIAWTPPGGEREIIAGRYLSPLKSKPQVKKP